MIFASVIQMYFFCFRIDFDYFVSENLVNMIFFVPGCVFHRNLFFIQT